MDRMDKKYDICNKIYDLIYELNIICPNILNTVLPQLECKLKSTSVQERLSKNHSLILDKQTPLYTDYMTMIAIWCNWLIDVIDD